MDSLTDTPKGWVAPFGNPGINVRSQLPQAFRSVPRPSSPLGAKASTRCPSRSTIAHAQPQAHGAAPRGMSFPWTKAAATPPERPKPPRVARKPKEPCSMQRLDMKAATRPAPGARRRRSNCIPMPGACTTPPEDPPAGAHAPSPMHERTRPPPEAEAPDRSRSVAHLGRQARPTSPRGLRLAARWSATSRPRSRLLLYDLKNSGSGNDPGHDGRMPLPKRVPV